MVQRNTNFRGQAPKTPQPNLEPVTKIMMVGVLALIGYLGKPMVEISKSLVRHAQICHYDAKNAEKYFYKASLASDKNNDLMINMDYLAQVVDSLKGGKATPNKTFKTDSLFSADSARLVKQSDSVLAAGKKQAAEDLKVYQTRADSIRQFARDFNK